jgi:hypothetical protein
MSTKKKYIAPIIIVTLAMVSILISVEIATGFCVLFTTGVSMEPTWKEYNIIWGHTPKTINDIHIGDIVVFHYQNDTIAHRVTDIIGSVIFAHGDNKEVCKDGQAIHFNDIIFIVEGQKGIA